MNLAMSDPGLRERRAAKRAAYYEEKQAEVRYLRERLEESEKRQEFLFKALFAFSILVGIVTAIALA